MLRPISLFLLLLLPLVGMAESGGKDGSPYLPLDAFVVNLQDGPKPRFLQVKIQIMSRDPKVIEVMKANMPPLRHAMIMLLAHQNVESIQTMEGREALRAQALTAAQEVFAQLTGIEPPKPQPKVSAPKTAEEKAAANAAEEAAPPKTVEEKAAEAQNSEKAAGEKSDKEKEAKAPEPVEETAPGIEALYFTEFIIQ